MKRGQPLRTYARLERSAPMERGSSLRATQWGTRPKKKVASWRDGYLDFPDDDKPKYTPYERAYMAWVRTLPCCVCGRPATKKRPNQASHVTLGANEKGTGMRVSHIQVVSHCSRLGAGGCHEQWDGRRGFCAGWSKDERYAMGDVWVTATQLLAIPEDRDSALALEALGLGRIIGDGAGSWSWLPGSLDEVPVEVLTGAVPA